MKSFIIILVAVLVIALPFLFRREADSGSWEPGDPELVVVTPHNEAIRQSFADGFSRWHLENFGKPVRIDWRVVGGTTEIMRYLASEFVASAKQHFVNTGTEWPPNGEKVVLSRKTPKDADKLKLWQAFRAIDDPQAITCGIDVFFGGGVYDHNKAARQGLSVPAWDEDNLPVGIFKDEDGRTLIPDEVNGETWRGSSFYGSALSTFGICYNMDRLKDLGIEKAPARWEDLADPRFMGQLGLTDPTKSGSVAKAFEMVIHTFCARSVAEAGYDREQIAVYEKLIAEAALDMGELPAGVPIAYQQAIEKGWVNGVSLVRKLGAQSRYFTVGSGKVPVDVSLGFVAAGLCIDFFGRYQSEMSTTADNKPVMAYITPVGGSSVTADPISLLRGARDRELGVRFLTFVLGEEGQKLWNYRQGTPGGPARFSLRRLPIRRDFYPTDDPVMQNRFLKHKEFLSDPLWQPDVDAYQLSEAFLYEPRWTGRHFGIQRDLVKAMCLDSGDELRAAWKAILKTGGPEANSEAMRAFEALPGDPYPLNWKSAVTTCAAVPRMDLLRAWTAFFRAQYRKARELAEQQ
ncbi:MAG: extracellular solute-binding protein [Kiritimatiellae bacterium]|jgi:iron(III) transport system substrate-binding protein|nr:extracellular solute-binding protein [Kiritimatiellia bacterium]